jgi:GDP-4-dehydro-6-deoxy-D-mannose reductase
MSGKTRVLVTGATGFAGRHLVRALEEDKATEFEVYGTSYPDAPEAFDKRIYYLDLRSEENVAKLVGDIKPDRVFHLAGVSNVRLSWKMRRETIETNVVGTQNLLEAVKQGSPVARVLFVSSSEVYGYGGNPGEPLTEEAPFEITSPYAYSKVAGEMLCGFYGRIENLDIVIARPFPHTGPGQSPDFVCSDWARQIALIERGDSPPVLKVGNLDVRRDFCDVRDVVKAYVLLMKKGRRGETYNICSGKAISLRKILDLLVKEAAVGTLISIKVDPSKIKRIDMPIQVGNNRKISEETDWVLEIQNERTLRDLLSLWRQSLSHEKV